MAALLYLRQRAMVHRALNRERVWRLRINPLDMNDHDLIRRYGLPRREIEELCVLLEADLRRPTCRSFRGA